MVRGQRRRSCRRVRQPNPAAPIAGTWVAVDSSCTGGGDRMDEDLITPVLDFVDDPIVTLEFDHWFAADTGEIADVDVRSSLTGGAVGQRGALHRHVDHEPAARDHRHLGPGRKRSRRRDPVALLRGAGRAVLVRRQRRGALLRAEICVSTRPVRRAQHDPAAGSGRLGRRISDAGRSSHAGRQRDLHHVGRPVCAGEREDRLRSSRPGSRLHDLRIGLRHRESGEPGPRFPPATCGSSSSAATVSSVESSWGLAWLQCFEDAPRYGLRSLFEINGTHAIEIVVLSGTTCGGDACGLDQPTSAGGHRVPERRDQGAARDAWWQASAIHR